MQIKVGLPTLLGGAINLAGLWHLLKWVLDWAGRYDAGRSIGEKLTSFSMSFPWIYGLGIIVGIAFIWWDRRRKTKEIAVTITPLVAAVLLSVCALGAWGWVIFDRRQGPIVWDFQSQGTPISWSTSGDDPIYFSAFQIQAF
jgi:UDP-N-acetylmuramyl pentapeptide phosphotransferase/UDP-N-acetylglucosamine-1-phosphate transferase